MQNSAPAKVSFLDRAFPVPHLLFLSDVSIDVSDGKLRFFELRRSRGQVVPKRYGVRPLPQFRLDSINDKARSEVGAALSAFATEYGFRNVRAVVHEDEAYVFRLTLPTTDTSLFRNIIESSLEENVPMPPAEAVFEYDVVSKDAVRNETVVSVTVLPEKSLASLVDLLRAGGLFPISFETEARAATRAVVAAGDARTHAILVIKEHHSVMAIVERGIVSFSSSIEVGTYDMTNAIAKSFGISLEAAAKMRLEKGFALNKEDTKIFDAMMPVLSTLHDEIGKMLVYWNTLSKKTRSAPAEDIILLGESVLMNGVAKYVSVTSKLPTKIASVWQKVANPENAVPDLHERESLDYAEVIGALLS